MRRMNSGNAGGVGDGEHVSATTNNVPIPIARKLKLDQQVSNNNNNSFCNVCDAL